MSFRPTRYQAVGTGSGDHEETRGLTASASGGELLDADTTDYWDDEQGLPPPHRLSTQFSPSPYPSSHDNLPLAPPRPSTSAYSDPFASSAPLAAVDENPSASMNGHDYYPPLDDVYTTGGPKGYMPAYDSSDSLAAKEYDADAWGGRPSYSPNDARDRWLARKEADAAAAGGAAGYSAYELSPPREPSGSSRKRWWIAGGVLVALVAIGVGVGVYLATRGNHAGRGATGAVKSDSKDPSNFTKDPRLHQSFYGLCYTPLDAQYPGCGDTLEQVVEDVQIMSQLTRRIRTYGADCQVPQLVLEAIGKTKVEMEVYLAVWVDDNATTYQRQVDELTDALTRFGADDVAGVVVGNEVLLNGGSEADLVARMAEMRTHLASLNLTKTLPVGTSDAGSMMTTTLGQGSDFVFSNTHPWFAGTTVEDAAGWVYSYTHDEEPASVLAASNAPALIVGEVGWPSGANETRMETYMGAQAGVPELQTLLDTYVCQANANVTAGTGVAYFYFEAFDEVWKDALYGGVEAHWGLFDKDKRLKDGLVIPDCASP